jgi:hypothetical protein
MNKYFISIVMFFGFCVSSYATTYCSHNGGARYLLNDGDNVTVEWIMTVAKNRKILTSDQTKPYEWCFVHWDSLGGFEKPIEVLVKPKNNEVGIYRFYRIAYRALKAGEDSFKVKITWRSRNNNEQSGIITYKVKVVENDL